MDPASTLDVTAPCDGAVGINIDQNIIVAAPFISDHGAQTPGRVEDRKTLLLHFDHIFQNGPPFTIGQGQRLLSLPIGIEELDGHASECLYVF